MEILNRDGMRWPDPVSGPFGLWTTVAIVDGRPEVVGVEMWAIDPATLPKRVTHLAKAEAERHWPRYPDPSWDSRTGAIRTKDLRLPLGRIVTEYMERQRHLAKGIATPGFVAKIARTLNPDLPPDQARRWEAPKMQAAARRILDLTDEGTAKKKAGRPPLPASHYTAVAAVYSEALRNGANPTTAVIDHFHVSKSQAAKWVYRCRREPYNLLGDTPQGRAGGIMTDREPEAPTSRRTK